jgi:molybdopterin-guanine dinucleotide biosynthesis protein
VHGRRLADRAAEVLGGVCDPVVEVGSGVTDLPALREDPAGSGPLAGLVAGAAALGAAANSGLVLLACDLPWVDEALLGLLAGWAGRATVVPVAAGRVQPVCARYGPEALAEAAALLASGERSLRAVLARTEHDVVDESVWGAVAPAGAFADVDTPADLARARRSADPGGR